MKEEILKILADEYVAGGFLHSGSLIPRVIADRVGSERDAVLDNLTAMAEEGLVQRRSCQALAFELPGIRRAALIKQHNLREVWETGAGAAFYPNSSHGEIAGVRKELQARHTELVDKKFLGGLSLEEEEEIDQTNQLLDWFDAIHYRPIINSLYDKIAALEEEVRFSEAIITNTRSVLSRVDTWLDEATTPQTQPTLLGSQAERVVKRLLESETEKKRIGNRTRETEATCPVCGPATNLFIRTNSENNSLFLACPNLPGCNYTSPIPEHMFMEMARQKRLL